jgi:hypothetical protein
MAKDTENEAAAGGKLRKLVVPTAVGVAGSAIAVALTRKPKQLVGEMVPKVREALPDLPQGGVGELTDDLKGRLDSVLGKDGDDDEVEGFDEQAPSRFDAAKFEQRRDERRKRREQRRRRAA